MASQTEKWLCQQLGKLGIDSTEDSARYILSMESSSDLEEYMLELLDGSNPKVRFFLEELKDRFHTKGKNKGNVQVYRKEKVSEPWEDKSKKKNKSLSNQNNAKTNNVQNKQIPNGNVSDMSSGPKAEKSSGGSPLNDSPQSPGEMGIGARKKTKYVPLYSKEGQEKSVVQLSGRHKCDCQAAKHKLINNCVQCGRVVCAQEGAGPCVFCGALVCTPEEMEVLDRGSRKSERLREQLMKEGGRKSKGLSETGQSLLPIGFKQSQEQEENAMRHRDKLLEYDRTSVRRTQVIDDECDYYATDSNRWLAKEDREKLRKREEELRESRHGSRRDRKITFDIAGRRVKVLDAEEDVSKTMYSKEDAVIQEVHYGKTLPNGVSNPDIVNPSYELEPPTFLDTQPVQWGRHDSFKPASADHLNPHTSSRRIQDKELQEMSDEGMCMSMHQPLASLLVHGIKMHEGRTWYTSHRGRLWIAATAKTPDKDETAAFEQFYRRHYPGMQFDFPKDYPSGCLLGCVNVDDCLDQDQYRDKFPDGESGSPYVFICTNPSKLLVKFPIKGKHKIYKLDTHIHQAAKKGLR